MPKRTQLPCALLKRVLFAGDEKSWRATRCLSLRHVCCQRLSGRVVVPGHGDPGHNVATKSNADASATMIHQNAHKRHVHSK